MVNRLISIDTTKTGGTQLPNEVRTEVTALSGAVLGGRIVSGQQSLAGGGDLSTNRTLNLVGDTATPGANKYYGTDGSAIRGFYTLPAGGSSGGGGGGSGITVVDHLDGTLDVTGTAVVDNADGTITVVEATTSVYSTAGRPSAVTSGNGAQIYDDTLNIPIWSDGTVWRNATGTAV